MVVGREAELAQGEWVVRAAESGRPETLLLVGDPGVGKTTILDAIAGTARDARQVRVRGVEAERGMPLAGMTSVVHALRDRLPLVPDGPRERLTAVLEGDTTSAPVGVLELGTALLALLGAGDEPVLLLADDLQWVDRTSKDALLFAVRRLHVEPVGLVATSRPEDLPSGLVRRDVSPLDPVSAVALLAPLGVDPVVANGLCTALHGLPLALVETARSLTPAQRRGTSPLPDPLPASSLVQDYASRIAALPEPARRSASVLALAGDAPPEVVDAALAALGLTPQDRDPLVEAGLLLEGSDGAVATWRHPMVRSAAASLDRDSQREVHRALSQAWSHVPTGALPGALHRAAADPLPDRERADSLAAAAQHAVRLGAWGSAALAWEAAVRTTPTDRPAERAVRLVEAADAHAATGSTARAASLLDEALALAAPSAVRVEALRARARLQHALGSPAPSLAMLREAAELSEDADVARWCRSEAVFAAMFARDDSALSALAAEQQASHPNDDLGRFLVAHSVGAAAALRGDDSAARPALQEAAALVASGLLETHADRYPELVLWAVGLPLFLGDPMYGLPEVTRAVERARLRGDLRLLPRTLRLLGRRLLMVGSWTEAYGLIEDALEVSRLAGMPTQVAEALFSLAELEAWRGEREACLAHAEEARALSQATGVVWHVGWAESVQAVLHLGLGDIPAALGALAKAPMAAQLPVAVEAHLRSGDREGALALAEQAEGQASVVELAVARVLLADDAQDACAGADALGDDPAAEHVMVAWARLAAGEAARRAGQRSQARKQLRASLETFEALGARPWAERAREALLASGATLRRDPERWNEVTGAESRVARLAAEGRSTREICELLFLSPKTVEFHLSRVYRKLGVRGRAELAATLREDSLAAPNTV